MKPAYFLIVPLMVASFNAHAIESAPSDSAEQIFLDSAGIITSNTHDSKVIASQMANLVKQYIEATRDKSIATRTADFVSAASPLGISRTEIAHFGELAQSSDPKMLRHVAGLFSHLTARQGAQFDGPRPQSWDIECIGIGLTAAYFFASSANSTGSYNQVHLMNSPGANIAAGIASVAAFFAFGCSIGESDPTNHAP